MKEFERGIRYGEKKHNSFFHLSFGYSLLVGALIFSFKDIYSSLFLSIFGLVSISLGYSEKKELNGLKGGKNGKERR